MNFRSIQLLCILMIAATLSKAQSEITNSRIHSPYQKDSTRLRVLLPDDYDKNKNYRVLYVLPVSSDGDRKYGDGLLEIQKYNYHNIHQLICVAPEFTTMPWFADHDLEKGQQDESHLLKTVIPFVDAKYATITSGEGRLLIGFSKSGWGALTLLLRNPEVFYKATGWDIGIRIDTGGISEEKRAENIRINFGTETNFEHYRISNLLKERGKQLGDKARLFYYNTEGNRGPGGVEIHQLMVILGIPHRYLYEPYRKHRWDTGWIPQAVEFLVVDD